MSAVRLTLGDLRLGEEFVTVTQRKSGVVLALGRVRAENHSYRGEPRPKWAAVRVQLDGKRMEMSPETVVLVSPTRPHWRKNIDQDHRWVQQFRDADGEDE